MSFAPPIPLPPIPGATASSTEWEFAWLDQVEGLSGVNPMELYRIFNPLERIQPIFYEKPAPKEVVVPPVSIMPVATSSFAAHDDERYTDVGDPPVPLEILQAGVGEGGFNWLPSTLPVIRSILPRSVAGGKSDVSTPTVWPEQEVVQYPEGDYPAGSIFAPGGIWGQPAEQHDLDVTPEDQEMADWGWIGDIIDVFQGQQIGGGQATIQPYFNAAPAYMASPTGIPSGSAARPPSAAPVLDRYGRPCRRRRRRRLLTNSDLKDLAALKTITGNNDALKMAVIKAVR